MFFFVAIVEIYNFARAGKNKIIKPQTKPQ